MQCTRVYQVCTVASRMYSCVYSRASQCVAVSVRCSNIIRSLLGSPIVKADIFKTVSLSDGFVFFLLQNTFSKYIWCLTGVLKKPVLSCSRPVRFQCFWATEFYNGVSPTKYVQKVKYSFFNLCIVNMDLFSWTQPWYTHRNWRKRHKDLQQLWVYLVSFRAICCRLVVK